MRTDDEDTAEYVTLDEQCFTAFFGDCRAAMEFSIGARSHPGLVRPENQDHFLVARRIRRGEVVLTSVPPESLPSSEEVAHLLLVADGIGGEAFGEVASRLVVTKTWELSQRAASWLMKLHDAASREPYTRVRLYVDMLQHAFREAQTGGLLAEHSGTTCTCAYVIGRHAIVANIGDSRAYLFRDGELRQLTRDHTVAQQLIDIGVPAVQAREFGNVLTSHLGTQAFEVHLEVNCVRLRHDDSLLVCSDGLTNEVSDEAIAAELRRGASPQEHCDRLVQSALDHGGHDNVTVLLATPSCSPTDRR